MKVTGEFQVKLQPMDFYAKGTEGINFGRMSIDKTFLGELEATSKGEMLIKIENGKHLYEFEYELLEQ